MRRIAIALFVVALASAAAQAACDCGPGDIHTGADWSAPTGTAVPVAADGVIVRIENDELAAMPGEAPGSCGRYVVVRHSHPSGRVAFTRYAHLGRIVGKGSAPLAVGTKVAKGSPVGEVGTKGTLHMEVRPLDEKTADNSEALKRAYGAEPSMQWARYRAVDPATFDFETMKAPAR